MWTRKDIKQKAKDALKRNYWRIVLVAMLAGILAGGASPVAGSAGSVNVSSNTDHLAELSDDMDVVESTSDPESSIIGLFVTPLGVVTGELTDMEIMVFGISLVVIICMIALFIMAFIYALMALLYNPFYTGVCRFMLKSVDDKADVKEIAYGFDHSYKNVVKTMFHTDIRVIAWTFLFIIPGIYKKYQYRMVPYILAEHPDMNYKEVLQMSRDIMNGEKWHVFVLDLSFILWHILGTITCGIVEVFYVSPYVYLTNAALYRRLCEGKDNDRQIAFD